MTESATFPVVVVNAEPEFATKLSSLDTSGRFPVLQADSLSQGESLATEKDAVVLVLGPSVPTAEALIAGKRICEALPRTAVVGVFPSIDTTTMREAMRSGLHDALCATEQTWAEVGKAVFDAAEEYAGKRANTDAHGASRKRAWVTMVAGTKGGVGKTMVATNLATALAKIGTNVVLVDLDLHTGDTGIMMQLEPTRTMRDAAAAADRLDAAFLEGLLTTHSSGARVLLAPSVPDDEGVITAARVVRVLDLLKDMADVIVIDTPAVWDEITLAAADASNQILAVTAMDLPSVKNTGVMLTRLRRLGRTNGAVHLLLNRADSKVLLEEKDVERALGTAVSTRIPSDRAVPRSVNKGVPIVVEAPRSNVSRAVVALAQSIKANGVKS